MMDPSQDPLMSDFEEEFWEQADKNFPAMQDAFTESLIESLEKMARIFRMNMWRRRLRFRRKR